MWQRLENAVKFLVTKNLKFSSWSYHKMSDACLFVQDSTIVRKATNAIHDTHTRNTVRNMMLVD